MRFTDFSVISVCGSSDSVRKALSKPAGRDDAPRARLLSWPVWCTTMTDVPHSSAGVPDLVQLVDEHAHFLGRAFLHAYGAPGQGVDDDDVVALGVVDDELHLVGLAELHRVR